MDIRDLAKLPAVLLLLASCERLPADAESTSQPAIVTPAYVQGAYSVPQSPQTAVSVALPSAQGVGNLLVVLAGWNDSTASVTSVSDTRGDTFALAIGPTRRTGALSQSIYYARNVAGGSNTVTVRFSTGARYPDIRVLEYRGIDTTAPLDSAVGASGSGSLASTGYLTTHAPGALLVAGDMVLTGTPSAGSGYTARMITNPDGDIAQDKIAGAAGMYDATAPVVAANAWVIQVAAFKAAAGGSDGGAGTSGTGGSAGRGGTGGAGTGGAAGRGGTGGATGGAAGRGGTGGATGGAGAGGAGTGGAAGRGGTGGATGGAGTAGAAGSTGGAGTGGAAGSAGRGGQSGGGQGGGAVFPLTTSTNGRYLVSPSGTPRPILGRTAWGLVSLSAADRTRFLDDTAARGFNAVEVQIPTHIPRINAVPRDGAGNLPFTTRLGGGAYTGISVTPDMTTPNESYWAFVDTLIADCSQRGILVLMFPAYFGIGGSDGWLPELNANGQTRVQSYGAYVGNRFRTRSNIVWMMAGDTCSGFDAETWLRTGISSTAAAPIHYSAERCGSPGSIATDSGAPNGPAMTLDGAYSWTEVVNQSRRAYAHEPHRPAYLLEEPYQGNDQYVGDVQRKFEWWGWLSTTEGYVAGDESLWPFTSGWDTRLDTANARDLGRLNSFVLARSWWQLVPSGLGGMGTIVGGTNPVNDGTYVAAAATPSGSMVVAYLPPSHTGTITIDMTKLAGAATGRWFDPTTGAYTTIAGSPFANTGTRSFVRPAAAHADGTRDWVLVLETP